MSWRAGIQGYAARWGVVTAPLSRPQAPHLSRPARFERGCFVYDPARVAIWFMHRQAQQIGRGDELGLELWEDAYGLAFTFRPPRSAWNLVCGVADGRYAHCSVGADLASVTTQRYGMGSLDVVALAALREISICPRGACPGAICWHIGNGPDALSSDAARLLPGWQASRSAQALRGRAE